MVIPCNPVSGTGSGSASSGSVCTTPCTCIFADDGIKVINNNYVVNTGEGRRNTVVDGSGTVSDPYTISFIDSEFYRPNAAEIGYPPQTANTGGEDDFQGGFVVYQTPEVIITSPTADFTVKGFFYVVGATVEFAANTTGTRKIYIYTNDSPSLGPLHHIAAATADAPAESFTMSCSGFWPGKFDDSGNTPVLGVSRFLVRVFQDSGGPLGISNMKFWVGTL